MRKILTLLFLGMLLWACNQSNQSGQSDQTEYVYITNGKKALAYHYSKECRGLKHAPDVSIVSIEDAKSMGRRPCGICVHDFVVSLRMKKDSITVDSARMKKDSITVNSAERKKNVFVRDNNDTLYHEFLDCSLLDSIHGYCTISFEDVNKKGLDLCEFCSNAANALRGIGNIKNNDQNIKNNDQVVKQMPTIPFFLALIFFILVLFFIPLLIIRHKKRGCIDKIDYKPEVHNTRIISLFLQQFAKRDSLKYTTHHWDSSSETGQPLYQNYDDFKEQYCKILSQNEKEVSSLCPHLWELIYNFMIDEEGGKPWSKYNIKVGYNKYVKKWMDEHSDEQPLNMPLSSYPDDIRPVQINKRSVNSFRQIVDIFKECIEFRDDNFYNAVRTVFKEHNISFDLTNLKCLKGLTFYTDTGLVKDALDTIADNLYFHRNKESPSVEVKSYVGKDDEKSFIRVEILNTGSFSNLEMSDPLITGDNKDKSIARIKEKLKNLCDFAVESTFKINDEIIPLHINYLVSNASEKGIYPISQEECLGFKYILIFYTYNQ